MSRVSILVAVCVLSACSDAGKNEAMSDQGPPLVASNADIAATPPAKIIPASAPQSKELRTEIPLEESGGTFVVPVTINDTISLKFTIDSGASYVTIPSDVASTLVRAGTITQDDYVGSDTFVLADGSEVPSPEFRIESLKVGNLVLHNVIASITNSKGSLLLGQTFLSKLQNWSIDNKRHVLVLAAEDQTIPPMNQAGDGIPAIASAESPSSSGASSAAESTVRQFFASWSNGNDPDGRAMRRYYGPTVNFYGKQIDATALMNTKLQFARRWPIRSYTIRDDSLRITCSDSDVCNVAGVLDWKARSDVRSRYSSGTATFAFVLDDGLIIEEHGRVLSRNAM